MTDKEREAFRRYIASAPSNEELFRQVREEAMKDPANIQQPGEHPIDWMIRRFFAHEAKSLKRSHDGVLIKCPVCGAETRDLEGRCRKCHAVVHVQPANVWWEGDVKLGVTICSCCDERLSTKLRNVRIVKVVSCSGGTLSYFERYIAIPICAKCNLRASIPFWGKKILDKNALIHFLFQSGCGLDEMTSPF